MLRILIVLLIIFINFILQSTLFHSIAIFGITPNTAIVIIVAFAIMRQDIEGAIIGFFAGLLQDIFFGNVIGLTALLYMFIGFLCGKPFKEFYLENYILPIALVGTSTILYNFLYYVINFLFRARLDFFTYFGIIILPETIYNIVLTLPLYIVLYQINKALEKRENEKRRMF
ncbi:MAG: rod shape-determining protein MreD [Defluviitaleaceae bacterium]|nr:rod shape-determining protein MreD [Defluviitaleaceae bacterium]